MKYLLSLIETTRQLCCWLEKIHDNVVYHGINHDINLSQLRSIIYSLKGDTLLTFLQKKLLGKVGLVQSLNKRYANQTERKDYSPCKPSA